MNSKNKFNYKEKCPKCKYATEYVTTVGRIYPPDENSYCLKRYNKEFDELLEIDGETGKQKLQLKIRNLHPDFGEMLFRYPKFDKNNVNIGDVEPKPYKKCSEVKKCDLYESR